MGQSENPRQEPLPCQQSLTSTSLAASATHLNIMLNSFRASSVTPVVFLEWKKQSL